MMVQTSEERIPVERGTKFIAGDLTVPDHVRGSIIFAHGSGSGRFSPRNRYVARVLNDAAYATLLADLLTPSEEAVDARTASLRFDVEMLAERLADAAQWMLAPNRLRELPVGYFGASTGAAAALIAAARRPERIRAVVSRGGRPDLAGAALASVRAPTLLIVGENDPVVIDLNRVAAKRMTVEVAFEIVPHATHLFEEAGALERVADLARQWFDEHVVDKTKRPQGSCA